MNKNHFHWLILAGLFLFNTAVFFGLDFNGALQQTDSDKIFYTGQLQRVILDRPTHLLYPLYRVLVPLLSIAVTALFGTSFLFSMQILSALALVLLIVYIYWQFKWREELFFSMSMILLSLPVVLLYSWSYFIEIPFFCLLLMSFWQWDEFCRNTKTEDLLVVMFFSIWGVLTKEAFLFHVLIMGVFLAVFFQDKLKRLLPGYVFLCLVVGAVYYLNYEVVFAMKKSMILNQLVKGPLIYNLKAGPGRFLSFFSFFRGGIVHAAINLLLAFGLTQWLIYKSLIRKKRIMKHLLYSGILAGIWMFIIFNQNAAQKFAFLCFGPSCFVFLSKNLPDLMPAKKLGRFLAVNYVTGVCLICLYVFIKNHY